MYILLIIFNRYSLSTYYVLSTVLDTGDRIVNTTDKIATFVEVMFQQEER